MFQVAGFKLESLQNIMFLTMVKNVGFRVGRPCDLQTAY